MQLTSTLLLMKARKNFGCSINKETFCLKKGVWTVKDIFLRKSDVSEKKQVVHRRLSTK